MCGQIAKDLNTTINNKGSLVRIEEGSETRHFLSLLKGQFLVMNGKEDSPRKETSLFQLRGSFHTNMKTLECLVSASYLYSGDVFILKTPQKIFIWHGNKSNTNLKNTAPFVAKKITSQLEIISIEEGAEPEEFWEAIGGNNEYISYEDPKKNKVRFWVCENVNKTYKCYELANFVQSELTKKRQAILDRYTEVIVWLGKETSEEDKKIVTDLALEYVEKSNKPFGDKRDPSSCNVFLVNQDEEPLRFTQYFQSWKTSNDLPPLLNPPTVVEVEKPSLRKATSKKFSYVDLSDKGDLPEGVDPLNLEQHLEDGEFPKVFGMSREEYFKKPKWKQMELKKLTKLF